MEATHRGLRPAALLGLWWPAQHVPSAAGFWVAGGECNVYWKACVVVVQWQVYVVYVVSYWEAVCDPGTMGGKSVCVCVCVVWYLTGTQMFVFSDALGSRFYFFSAVGSVYTIVFLGECSVFDDAMCGDTFVMYWEIFLFVWWSDDR